jgi:hypothetical protein
MLWLKRNLPLAVAILVAVVLSGAGGYFVWKNKSTNDELNERLGAAKRDLDRLTQEIKPSPTPDNVKAAREDSQRSQAFSALCRRLFAPTPYTQLNGQSYRSMLETEVAGLRRLAQSTGVDIPTNYYFSFEAQSKPMTFEPYSLKPLSDQLSEIRSLCQILFNARIHTLDGIRRVAVSQYDLQNSAEIMTGYGVQSNRFTALQIWPYQVSFECFSEQLAAVMSAVSQSPRMILVKNVTVETVGEGPRQGPGSNPDPNAPPASVPRAVPGGRGPGRRGMPAMTPAPATPAGRAAAAAAKPAGLTTALEEQMLRVNLLLHVIKPDR